MVKSIVVFLAVHDSMLLIVVSIIAGALVSSVFAILFWKKFRNAWDDSLGSLIDELNSSGIEIANTLIEIAMISASGDRGFAIGMVKKDILNNSKLANFFVSLLPIIEEINDKNDTIILNGHYAAARDSIKEAIALVKKYQNVGDFESFAEMAVEVAEAKRKLKDSARNLDCKLCGLKSDNSDEST